MLKRCRCMTWVLPYLHLPTTETKGCLHNWREMFSISRGPQALQRPPWYALESGFQERKLGRARSSRDWTGWIRKPERSIGVDGPKGPWTSKNLAALQLTVFSSVRYSVDVDDEVVMETWQEWLVPHLDPKRERKRPDILYEYSYTYST